MLDSISFTTLVLGEVIFLLSVIVIFLFLALRKHRQQHQYLIDEYRKLRQNIHIASHPEDFNHQDPSSKDHKSLDPVDIFLAETTKDALARYKKITQATHPRLSPELPFNAKVAALRYLYANAEMEIRREKTVNDEYWMLFEKKLADIIRWVGSPKKITPAPPNNRIRLLQEKIDVLKPFEKENAKLHKQLEAAEAKHQRLLEYERDSKETLAKMQRIIQALQLANAYKGESIDQKINDALLPIDSEHGSRTNQNYQASVHQLDSIADISGRKYSIVKKMVEELPYAYRDLSSEQRQKMQDSIRSLEYDLIKSDHHITNLQKELKAAKESMMQKPLVITEKPITPFNKYSPGKEALIHPLPGEQPVAVNPGPVEETLTIVHSNQPEEDSIEQRTNQWVTEGGPQRTRVEIEHLRTNNQNQRNIIIDLEKELRSLRKAMNETTDEGEKENKGKDIQRLERLVKECEHCIETLESEVDLLHQQLEQHGSLVPVEEKPHQNVEKLNQELEVISGKLQHTIKQHVQTSILNRFAVDALAGASLEDLSKLIIKAIKDLHITAGFYLYSDLGNAEYYAGNSFTPSEQKIIKQTNISSAIAYLNEGILFSRPGIHLLLRNPPDDDDEQLQLEHTLSNMISIMSAQIAHLEANTGLQRQSRRLASWIKEAKQQLNQLDIQYAYQAEESRRIIENFTREIKKSMGLVEMSDTTRMVFDNIISECYQRLHLLLDSGKIIDRTSSQLIKSLDKLAEQK